VRKTALIALAFLPGLATRVTKVATYVPDLSLRITPLASTLRLAARV
jgi:hypothetical protein